MKITKIMLAALCLSLFSCSQEDVSTTSQNSSVVNLKANKLSDSDVQRLTAEFVKISKSEKFLNKKSVVNEFTYRMNKKFISNISSAADMEMWLTQNLSQTKFSSVAQGVNAFNNMVKVTNDFYNENIAFYLDLGLGSVQQIEIIFQPILDNPGFPVQSTSSCDDACLDAYQAALDSALDNWNRDMDFAEMPGNATFIGSMSASADWRFDCALANAETSAWDCFGNCD